MTIRDFRVEVTKMKPITLVEVLCYFRHLNMILNTTIQSSQEPDGWTFLGHAVSLKREGGWGLD